VNSYNLRNRRVAPPVGNSGADSSSDDEDRADWAENPLFERGTAPAVGTPVGTPVQSGQAGDISPEAAALRCLPTPRRLDFAIAESAQLGQVDASGSPAPVFGTGNSSFVVNRGPMAEGLVGRLGMLGLGAGGASSSTGGGSSGGKWTGDAGMSFCLFRIDVEPKVAEAQAKGRTPRQQFGIIASHILPMSPGFRVHNAVVQALDPFVRIALLGQAIEVDALVSWSTCAREICPAPFQWWCRQPQQ
jgi:hypothetical protein